MDLKVRQKLDGIFGYPFFLSVRKPVTGHITRVDNWHLAIEVCNKNRKWENCRLMAGNALQRFVEERCWSRIEDWDPLTDELRPLIVSFVDSMLPKSSVPKELFGKIRDHLCWDIMGIGLEYHYKDLIEPIFYLPVPDPWYAAGHFPCGWDGEEFPDRWDGVIREGRLIVF